MLFLVTKLIELARVTCRLNEVKHKDLLERCVRHLSRRCSENAGRWFLHEHPWTTWSWDVSFVKEVRDKDDVYEAKGNACPIPDELASSRMKESRFMLNNRVSCEQPL